MYWQCTDGRHEHYVPDIDFPWYISFNIYTIRKGSNSEKQMHDFCVFASPLFFFKLKHSEIRFKHFRAIQKISFNGNWKKWKCKFLYFRVLGSTKCTLNWKKLLLGITQRLKLQKKKLWKLIYWTWPLQNQIKKTYYLIYSHLMLKAKKK